MIYWRIAIWYDRVVQIFFNTPISRERWHEYTSNACLKTWLKNSTQAYCYKYHEILWCYYDRCESSPRAVNQMSPRHQFSVQMLKAKVSWLLCIGRLVSKTDNVMYFAKLVKQVSVDLVSDQLVL